ncbi:hypothetical protein ACFVFQ_31650 [Streptomyces sp. NPDC057743]|uniref:hypothetical protein n=1 Tax=Streptomyces sp. NPDC057743 TaxID=3346236 RepID=UPI0036979197
MTRTRGELEMVRAAVLAERDQVIRRYRAGWSMARLNRNYDHPGEQWLAAQFDRWGEPRGVAAGRPGGYRYRQGTDRPPSAA